MDAQTRDYLAHLLRLADDERLSELRLEGPGLAIHLRRRRRASPARPRTAPQPAAAEPRADLLHIRSPLLGIFYRSPSPEAEAFVAVGELVEVGQTIGVVEAMKVFNEITSEVAGRVVKVLAEPGQLVHAGDPLIALEPLG